MIQNSEKRLFGAMSVIHHQDKVLVYVDQAKPEMSSITQPQEWWMTKQPVLNFPSGGRQLNQYKLEETLRQTLERELTEETLAGLDTKTEQVITKKVVLPKKSKHIQNAYTQQRYPFVAAQLKPNVIHQIGVTSAYIAYDSFSLESKYAMQTRVDYQLAFWIRLKDIYEALMDGKPQDAEFFGLKARPQMFTAAFIWYSEKQNVDPRLLDLTLVYANKEIIKKINAEATLKQIEKRNGAFEDSGKISLLSNRDRHFILGR